VRNWKIGLNGKVVDAREAVIPVYDHGLMYGMGCFETLRTYGGVPFLLDRHMERLRQSCAEIGIRVRLDTAEGGAMIASLLEANGLTDAYVRCSVTAGVAELGLPAGEYERPNLIIYMKELAPAGDPHMRPGKPLQLLRLRRNSPEGTRRLKSFHYMNNLLGKRECASYPWATGAEGLFLDHDGYVAEGVVSNLFFVRGGICRTPCADLGILAGITRECVLRLAHKSGIPAEEGRYTLDELLEAEEMFLTNSVQEIVPVSRLYGTDGAVLWSSGSVRGPVTAALTEQYRETIREVCGRERNL